MQQKWMVCSFSKSVDLGEVARWLKFKLQKMKDGLKFLQASNEPNPINEMKNKNSLHKHISRFVSPQFFSRGALPNVLLDDATIQFLLERLELH